MKTMGIVNNTLFIWIEGARIEVECAVSDGGKSDLIEYEEVKEYSSYKEMIDDFKGL